MKNTPAHLKIFCFSHPLINTEWTTILGDKYSHALPLKWEMVDHPNEAQIIVWDGVITFKNKAIVDSFLSNAGSKKILLLLGESTTLLKENPIVRMVSTSGLEYVEVPGWSILPEEILGALEMCYQKLNHV